MSERRALLSASLSRQLCLTNSAVSDVIARHYQAYLQLTTVQWCVLAALGETGPRSQTELSTRTNFDKVAINRACKALEERGFIVRRRDFSGSRTHRIDLSLGGLDTYRKIAPTIEATRGELFSVISENEMCSLEGMLDKICRKADTLISEAD